ncbi:MAG: alpha-ketoacid dehydrogenase subunit beta [Bdellovibrionales bacterium]
MSARNYGEAIRDGFAHLLKNHKDVFCIGQGLWSPWYVGNSMTNLDKDFGQARVIDTPVSEAACTGAAIGAALCGYKPIVIHPRVDFMILATDPIVNQAAKWGHMLGGQSRPSVTIRGIVNRGGQQGAQHSQALHSWFSHVPGLRVVMPATAQDARDLLISATLCPDPVLYIDDRWLYDLTADLGPVVETPLEKIGPQYLRRGQDVTLVGASYSTQLCLQAADELAKQGVDAEVVDLRVLNPWDPTLIIESVRKTGRLVTVDGSWRNCGLAGEVMASVAEFVSPRELRSRPARVTIAEAPAPTSKVLEDIYYPKTADVVRKALAAVREGAN